MTGPEGQEETALGWAALYGHLESARVLLEAGADPNLGNEGNWTPLMSAAYGGHADVVELLLKHGADPGYPGLPKAKPPLIGQAEKKRKKSGPYCQKSRSPAPRFGQTPTNCRSRVRWLDILPVLKALDLRRPSRLRNLRCSGGLLGQGSRVQYSLVVLSTGFTSRLLG